MRKIRIVFYVIICSIVLPACTIQENGSLQLSDNTAGGQKDEGVESAEALDSSTLSDLDNLKKYPAGTVINPGILDKVQLQELFFQSEITDEIFERMREKSYKEDCTVPLEELRYIKVLHWGFDNVPHIGELVVERSIAEDILDIFYQLYEARYPIEKMHLIDDYNGDDEASMADNNTTSFNYRKVSNSGSLSNHAKGAAIDINPLYNPYVRQVEGQWIHEPANAGDFTDRSREFDYKIDENDLCYQLFMQHEFTWGGHWKSVKDYQHFQRE